jgi:hypothetical protein
VPIDRVSRNVVRLILAQNLSTALQEYDLRDYMLIKSRPPGPRAKHTDLPAIPYGTVRQGAGWGLGMCVSYRFFEKDVKKIAALVHGDIDKHMAAKRSKAAERKEKRLRQLHIDLRIRQYTDRLATAANVGNAWMAEKYQGRE